MARRDIKSEISARLDEFVDELYELIAEAAADAVHESLGAVREATRGGGTAAPRRATKKRATKKRSSKKRATKKRAAKAKKGGRRVRRSSDDVEATGKAIVAQLGKTPGIGVGELATAMSADSADLKRPIAVLLEAGSIRKTGEKRGTKYFTKGRR